MERAGLLGSFDQGDQIVNQRAGMQTNSLHFA